MFGPIFRGSIAVSDDGAEGNALESKMKPAHAAVLPEFGSAFQHAFEIRTRKNGRSSAKSNAPA